MVWYSHLFKNSQQFFVIHTVKGIDRVNKAEVDVSLELSCFFKDPVDVGNLIFGSSAFSKSPLSQSLLSGSFHKPLIFLYQREDRLKTTITEN